MNTAVRTTLSDEVIRILEDYLGPAAESFVERQIGYHLNKKPDELTPQDLPKLSEWIKVSMALLTEDKQVVDACEKRILALNS